MPHSYIIESVEEEPADKIKSLIKVTSRNPCHSYVDKWNRPSVFFGPTENSMPSGYGFNFTEDDGSVTISLGEFVSGHLTLGQMLNVNDNGCESTEGQFKEGIVIYGSSICYVRRDDALHEFFHSDVQLSGCDMIEFF